MKRILADYKSEAERVALVEDGVLKEIFIDPPGSVSMIGQIILGTVQNILPTQFAFIEIGRERCAFMNLGGAKALKCGQPVLVQVYKDASGTKGANVGQMLHFNGRLVILYENGKDKPSCGVSQKITDKPERARLRKILREALPPGFGAIARTNSQGRGADEIAEEINRLAAIQKTVRKKAKHLRPPAVVYGEGTLFNDILSDSVDEIITNDPAKLDEINRIIEAAAPALKGRARLHDRENGLPLFAEYGVEAQIEEALRQKVWLPCGGFVTFEQTEACVVADVNTGKFVGKKNNRDTIMHANTEAAECVAHQIRLRNLSGMIIIDFIDMEHEADKRNLIASFEKNLSKDRIKTEIVGMTELGLVQLTRKKTRESLSRLLERDCPHCGGTGLRRKDPANSDSAKSSGGEAN